MSALSEFNQHTGMLHDSLRGLLERSAVSIGSAIMVGSGLLKTRVDDKGKLFRPRLTVIAGAAQAIGNLIKQEDVRDDMFAIGATRQDDASANMSRVFVAYPGVAKDALRREDLEPEQIVKLSHRLHTAEPDRLTAWQAAIYYQRILEKLGGL